ncbi:F0F1 ATP synthase subunit delta [Parabacteroides distasonis]|nr:F0F1 ATP synthase subunit delta [Parabacteroides distasonis]
MDIGTISSRYAKALFSLAKDKGQESRVYDDMKMLADSFSMEPELRGALSNPIVSVPEKVKLLTAAGGYRGMRAIYTFYQSGISP